MYKLILAGVFSFILSLNLSHAQKYSEQAKAYFKEVALGSEYGNTQDKRIKKWDEG